MPEEPRLQKFGDPFVHGDPDMPARANAVTPHNVVCANSACNVEGGRVMLTGCVCLRSDEQGSPHNIGTWCSTCNDAVRTYNLQKSGEAGPIFESVDDPKPGERDVRVVEKPEDAIEKPAVLQGETQPVPDRSHTVDFEAHTPKPRYVNVGDEGKAQESTKDSTNDSNDLPAPGPVGGEVADTSRRPRPRADR